MSKPNRKRYKLEAVRSSYAEAVGGEAVEFEVGDGKVFSFPHPMFASDEEQRALDDAEGDHGKARVLLGDQYEAFGKAGGDDNSVMLLYVAVRAEAQDTVQRHRPTRG
ncbi:hypothetical protein ABT390_36555 [Streptomyces aurantiacus]|uniref:Uncharacterized protein n=1 Tax=Streptomyces aurantiacus JA 4570 TaxID=1286094 RepID=S3ZCI5_9ACTN|nr:hypothetical protein [Streptomyces aurantiacus]EPH40848.1 hypothetical protein STRAU_6063 [Streptomyces aurantiacus JA 4570]